MDLNLKKQFLSEAIRIADEILSLAEYDENGISWETMSIDHSKKSTDPDYIIRNKTETIYTGSSGIALFFLELYKQTRNSKYLDSAIKTMKWVVHYCDKNPTDYYAFITGRIGVSYCLLKMFEVTKDDTYLTRTLDIAKACDSYLKAENRFDDFINGTSGTLWCLLYLHAATNEQWLLGKIDLFLQHLIDQAHHGPGGLYWDYSAKQIRGLCGFSHGAAGVGFVFLEAGRYLQNKALYYIAEQAFRYEAYFYSAAEKNWPDFRKGIWEPKDYEEHKNAYLVNNIDFFTVPKFMNAWCHGAAGIGLSRLRAFEILGSEFYADEARNAIEATKASDVESDDHKSKSGFRSYTLCHGSGGNADLFLEAYKTFNDETYLALAEKVAFQALNFNKFRKIYISGYVDAGPREDTSLFMGNAGIGYFFLRLLEPLQVPSILLPRIDSTLNGNPTISGYPGINMTNAQIWKRLMQINFERTLCILEKLLPKSFNNLLKDDLKNEENSQVDLFIERIKYDMILELPCKKKEVVLDVFSLELKKWKLEQAIESASLLNIKTLCTEEQAREFFDDLGEEEFTYLNLRLDSEVRILVTGWNWSVTSKQAWLDNLNIAKDQFPILLKMSATEKVIEEKLLPLSYTVLTAFQNGNKVIYAIEDIENAFGLTTDAQKSMIKKSAIQQIQQAMLSGILVLQ